MISQILIERLGIKFFFKDLGYSILLFFAANFVNRQSIGPRN